MRVKMELAYASIGFYDLDKMDDAMLGMLIKGLMLQVEEDDDVKYKTLHISAAPKPEPKPEENVDA